MQLLDFFHIHESFLLWMTGISFISLVLSSILIPMVVVRIPADYFNGGDRFRLQTSIRHPLMRAATLCVKNTAGYFFIVAGILMLVLPGQGLITVLVGVMLIDFPGKFRFEKWLVSRRPVLNSINWLRKRAGCSPLVVVYEWEK